VTASNDTGTEQASTQVVITDVSISGLQVATSSPTMLGEATWFTATVQSGTNASFSWDFGDGSYNTGQLTSHLYLQVGDYSVEVVASNSINSLSTVTTITIMPSSTTFRKVYIPFLLHMTVLSTKSQSPPALFAR
jgi:PKD repeat protein